MVIYIAILEIKIMLQTAEDIRLLNEKIEQAAGFVTRINDELSKVIVGQNTMIERLGLQKHWL
jgi:hypothetical protein